jgi:DNA-binding IclR family transcriptional regulator
MSGKADPQRYLVPGLARGIEILRLFSRERARITAPEMARELDIPRSTIFRLVQTLEHLGLLESDESGHGHRLAVGLLGLGFEYISSLDVTEVGRAELERLRDTTGQSAHLVVRDGTEVVVVLKAAGHSAFSGSLNVGTRLPAHGTVLGRVMLADLTSETLRQMYGLGNLEIFSPQTPTTAADLSTVLARDSARGYAVSRSFFERGISSVAAPIRDNSGAVIAAINVTVAGEMDIPDDVVGAVCACADAISSLLHYRPQVTLAANQ